MTILDFENGSDLCFFSGDAGLNGVGVALIVVRDTLTLN